MALKVCQKGQRRRGTTGDCCQGN